MREIPLSRDLVAVVSDRDYHWLVQWRWHVGGAVERGRILRPYAQRSVQLRNGRTITIRMHNLILPKPPNGCYVDHKNLNTLDNRRSNLRYATRTQQSANRSKFCGSTDSKYKGVRRTSNSSTWTARITTDGHTYHLGTFKTELAAARAYNAAALEFFGEFARLNQL